MKRGEEWKILVEGDEGQVTLITEPLERHFLCCSPMISDLASEGSDVAPPTDAEGVSSCVLPRETWKATRGHQGVSALQCGNGAPPVVHHSSPVIRHI